MANSTFAKITVSLVLVSAFLLVQLAQADDSVIDYSNLSPDAFKSEIDSLDLVLVKFYAPWCGHCKRLAPEYELAAKKLAGDDPAVPLAKVDCTNENGGKDICSQNEVQGYPTVKIFRNGQASDYNDGRDADSIVKKMRSLAGPASKEFDSFEKLDSYYKTAKNLVVVGLFKSSDDSLYKQFIETANQNRDLASYVHLFEDKASDKFEKLVTLNADKSVKLPSIVLARQAHYRSKFEPDFLVYDASDDLKDWIQENSHGLVMARTQANSDVPKPNVVVYYNVDYERDPKGTNYWRNRVLKVASQYKDQDLTFAVSNIQTFASELNDFGLDMSRISKDPSPAVVAKDKDGKKYAMSEKFTYDSFKQFVQSFLDGKLEPFMKSEDEPDNEGAAVKVAVGKNFDKLVTKSDKDVFIEFYAPWCGHCKSLAPTWEELGNKLKDEPGVDIVKLDATANDVPDLFTVHGFPTLYWFPKDTKTPVKYEGGRDINDLLNYVAKHATDELDGYTRTGDVKRTDL
uniref:Protein disulfide-isomerase n=1 Tax=Aceria tosichella TaxID=561515 RepID=A0A6G1S6Q9_9ACAR